MQWSTNNSTNGVGKDKHTFPTQYESVNLGITLMPITGFTLKMRTLKASLKDLQTSYKSIQEYFPVQTKGQLSLKIPY